MAPNDRYDPLTTFCFELVIDGMFKEKEAFFKSVSGLKSETEVVPYREGGLNGHTHQLVGATKWPNLVLKRGFVAGSDGGVRLIRWRERWTSAENKTLKRRSGKVIQLDSKMERVCSWTFIDGWPCRWEGPEYDASKSELAVETIEIAHSGLFFEGRKGR